MIDEGWGNVALSETVVIENMHEHCYSSNDTIEGKELYLDKYFSKKYSLETLFFSNDSSITTIFQPEKDEFISRRPETFDWFFGVFLIIFILFGHVIGKSIKISFAVIIDLFAIKGKKSIFLESTKNEWYSKLFLCFQTCLLTAAFFCKYFDENSGILLDSPMKSIVFLLLFTFALCVFFVVKCGMYFFVGTIFFDKETFRIWIDNFFSLLASLGVFLFIPVLFYFYDVAGILSLAIIFICFILFELFVIYKSILLFFYKPSLLLHLFLYLCGQEIIPLLFLWKSMFEMFNFVAK